MQALWVGDAVKRSRRQGNAGVTPGGALVMSLDFELAWGMLDVADVEGAWRDVAVRTREAVPRMLDRFAERGVAATWGTVGLLFAHSREEALKFLPEVRPRYAPPLVDPYALLQRGAMRDEASWFAPTLVEAIVATPGQELASHSFGHFTALEDGFDRASFEADVAAAVAIAAARGVPLRSWIWPRHQVRPEWLPILAGAGFDVHRGPARHRWYAPAKGRQGGWATRAARLADAYLALTGNGSFGAAELDATAPLLDVPESRFLRPAPLPGHPWWTAWEPLRVERIVAAMRHAARNDEVLHVWWHPHNFGGNPTASFAALDTILEAFEVLRDAYGMASWSMAGLADAVRAFAGRGSSSEGSPNTSA